jgi:hypothetical protein
MTYIMSKPKPPQPGRQPSKVQHVWHKLRQTDPVMITECGKKPGEHWSLPKRNRPVLKEDERFCANCIGH